MGRLIKSRFNGRKNHGKIDKPAGFAIIDVSIVDRSIISEEELNGTYFSYAAIKGVSRPAKLSPAMFRRNRPGSGSAEADHLFGVSRPLRTAGAGRIF